MAYSDSVQVAFNAHSAGHAYGPVETLPCVNGTGSTLSPGVFLIKSALIGSAISAKAPVAADFTARSESWAITNWATTELLEITGTFRGVDFSVTGDFDTDNNTSVASLVTKFNALIDGFGFAAGRSILAAASPAGTLVLTAEIPGDDFVANLSYFGAAITIGTKTSAGTSLKNLLIGVGMDGPGAEVNTSDAAVYQDGAAFNAIRKGDTAVTMLAAAATSRGNDLYISTASATAGQVSATEGADRVWVSRDLVRWTDSAATSTFLARGAVARVTVNL